MIFLNTLDSYSRWLIVGLVICMYFVFSYAITWLAFGRTRTMEMLQYILSYISIICTLKQNSFGVPFNRCVEINQLSYKIWIKRQRHRRRDRVTDASSIDGRSLFTKSIKSTENESFTFKVLLIIVIQCVICDYYQCKSSIKWTFEWKNMLYHPIFRNGNANTAKYTIKSMNYSSESIIFIYIEISESNLQNAMLRICNTM